MAREQLAKNKVRPRRAQLPALPGPIAALRAVLRRDNLRRQAEGARGQVGLPEGKAVVLQAAARHARRLQHNQQHQPARPLLRRPREAPRLRGEGTPATVSEFLRRK